MIANVLSDGNRDWIDRISSMKFFTDRVLNACVGPNSFLRALLQQ